jgi:hypothetical protein
LEPPLDPAPFRVIDSDRRTLMTTENDTRFATVQAFSQKGRDVLLVSDRNAPEKIGILTRRLELDNGWYDLSGDVWIQGDDEEPALLRVRGSGLRIEPLAASAGQWWNRIRVYAFGLSFVVLAGFLFFTYPRVVRRK